MTALSINNVIMAIPLKTWLEGGYMEENSLYNTRERSLQGGIASPILANIPLDGLEKTVLAIGKQNDKINFVRYADDSAPRILTRYAQVKRAA